MSRMPTRKQLDYIEFFSRTGMDPKRRRECMRVAGYSDKTPPSVVEKSKAIRHVVERCMKRHNLTPERVCEKLDTLLDCEDPAHPGKPDNKNQLSAIDKVCKLGDYYPSQKLEVKKTEEFVRIDIETARIAEELTGEKIIELEQDDEGGYAAPRIRPNNPL